MRPGPLRLGQDFGPRYHVVKLLGSGGMGVVYQALDRELGVEIALKVLRAPAAGLKNAASVIEMQRRFKTELLLARQITHRHVIRIHDIGEINGIRFISMPLVKGPDFASLMRNGALSVSRAIRYARQIASALVAVHAAGVVHRDLKPANIMLGADDHALLMDFGIARSSAPASPQRTIPGAVVGTMAYMAPEQARGETADQRSDIYAFGLILYEMLAGGRQTVSIADLAARLKAPPRPVRQINPRVPAALDAVVTRCLQPLPGDRYQTAAELAAALAALTRRRTGAPLGSDGTRRWLAIAAALLLVAAVAAAVRWLATPAAEAMLARAEAVVGRTVGALNPSTLFARERGHAIEAEAAFAARGVTGVWPPAREARARVDRTIAAQPHSGNADGIATSPMRAAAASVAAPSFRQRTARPDAPVSAFTALDRPTRVASGSAVPDRTPLAATAVAGVPVADSVSWRPRGSSRTASVRNARTGAAVHRGVDEHPHAYERPYLAAWRVGEVELPEEFQVCYLPQRAP